ncbi:MAG: hypothetical protein IH936_07345 [Acidobacteria bacterium]|nr:hypothetical protein [Acidobacteriota bacterium]
MSLSDRSPEAMFGDGLRQILLDRERGAAVLLHQALVWLGDHPGALSLGNREATLRTLRRTRPEMSGFASLASRLELESSNLEDPGAVLRDLMGRLDADETRLVDNAVACLNTLGVRRVITLSSSSSVAAALEARAEKIETVHVLESLPGGEGRELAKRLGKTLADVRLHADDELAAVVDAADTGVIGADSVFPDGSVLNKVLSAELGRLLDRAGKPLLVLTTSWKNAEPGAGTRDAEGFEIVPARWITRVVTECPTERR